MKVYCSECGKANDSENIYCKSCNATLKTDKIEYGKQINSFEALITEENYKILNETYFTPKAYNAILEEIIRIGYDKFTYNENKSTLENVYDLVDEYVNIFAKHKGSALGYYVANEIFIDERLPEAEQIATLIHELTHHLYSEIFERWMMYALKVEKNIYIESFVLFSTIFPERKFLNEYVAHTTEGQFILHGSQNYGSFIQIMEENKINLEEHKDLIALGRSISNDITNILEYFIDEDFRKRIIQQYTIDNVRRNYDQIKYEESPEMDENTKTEYMGVLLRSAFKACLEKEDYFKYLSTLKNEFKKK